MAQKRCYEAIRIHIQERSEVDGDLFFGNAGDWGAGFADRFHLESILACVALADARASDTDTEPLAVASG